MADLEEAIDTPGRQVPSMAEDEEQEIHQVEGGEVAVNMNPGQRKWLRRYYWILVIAASEIVLNDIDSAPKEDQLFPPEFFMFITFLCAISLIHSSSHELKQMM